MSTISYSPSPMFSAHRSQVRLTRRGRVVVLVLALLAVVAVGIALASASAAGNDPGTAEVHLVTVQPGETLWDIAGRAAGRAGVDTGEMVQRLEDLNTIDDGVVYAGQELRVPND